MQINVWYLQAFYTATYKEFQSVVHFDVIHQLNSTFWPRVIKYIWLLPPDCTDAKNTLREEKKKRRYVTASLHLWLQIFSYRKCERMPQPQIKGYTYISQFNFNPMRNFLKWNCACSTTGIYILVYFFFLFGKTHENINK